jgi:hypothetical protein
MIAGLRTGKQLRRKGRNVMQKLIIAIVATAALGVLPVSAEAADAQGTHHHRARHHAGAGPSVDPAAVRDGYVMNGGFDWRRIRPGKKLPWYAHGYTDDCVAWTEHAYHYACDPNNRY